MTPEAGSRIGRSAAVVAVATTLTAFVAVPAARAAVRESTVGNYYFQDDASGSRERIVVERGDQVRFTVREAAFSPHTVRVDELGIRSPDLQLFDTFTTPVLDRPGSYRLYCSRHQDNPGQPHVATLVVRAPPSPSSTTVTTSAPSPPAAAGGPSRPGPPPSPPPAATAPDPGAAEVEERPAAAPAPTAVTIAAGLGRAADRTRPPPAPNSLAAVLGRRSEPGPWTRAVGLALVALVAMSAAAAGAVARGRRLER